MKKDPKKELVPVIKSVEITPNPVNAGEDFLISVKVDEEIVKDKTRNEKTS